MNLFFLRLQHTVCKESSRRSFFGAKSAILTLCVGLQKIFALRGERFAEQLFRNLDPAGTGFVIDEQIVGIIVALERGSFEEKVAFLWSFITEDGDQITREELKELIQVRLIFRSANLIA